MAQKKQYGVIPYTTKKNRVKLILITSRINGLWIFPKGNPIKNKTIFETAEQEAFEEAGIRGKVQKKQPYSFSYSHRNKEYEVTLFPMKVETILDDWPEQRERERKTVSIEKALSMITLDNLRQCLLDWQKDTENR